MDVNNKNAHSLEDNVESQKLASRVFEESKSTNKPEEGKLQLGPVPEYVQKSRSQIIDNIISNKTTGNGIEDQEISEITDSVIETRVSISIDEDQGISCSSYLTVFDKEVIDAVSTLAVSNQVMTSSMIYRVIVGKDETSQVGQAQKQRVEESMVRCSRCRVRIDLTENFIKDPQEDQSLIYSGQAISFTELCYKKGRGKAIYYKVLEMPPFFKFAESLGKLSVIPLKLLDTPVSKTENIISIQSFLLKEIENAKREKIEEVQIIWSSIYDAACLGGKKSTRSENTRTRVSVVKIIEFWMQENFIVRFDMSTRKYLKLYLSLSD